MHISPLPVEEVSPCQGAFGLIPDATAIGTRVRVPFWPNLVCLMLVPKIGHGAYEESPSSKPNETFG